MKGYMYILQCADSSYYTGSTRNPEKRLPVQLVYFEEYSRIDVAFYREKQVQGWSRKKKEALINGSMEALHFMARCKNATHYLNCERRTSAPLNLPSEASKKSPTRSEA